MIVAPFLGEFGWLVAVWVPWLRNRIQTMHAGQDVTVLCEHGQEFLFDDFARRVKAVEVDVTRRDCQNAWVQGCGPMKQQSYLDLVNRTVGRTPKARIITPSDMRVTWPAGECPRLKEASHRAYYEGYEHRPNRVALHVRACVAKQPERNWSRECAEDLTATLTQAGYEVVAVGHPNASICPLGAQDFRGVRLELTCKALASCFLAMGPSSGPLHLANYCLTPVLWWSANEKDVDRYKEHWNPFWLPNRRVGTDWQPSADEIFDAMP